MFTLAIIAAVVLLFATVGVITEILTLNFTRQGEALTSNVTLTASGSVDLSESWVAAPTDLEREIEFQVADVVMLYMKYTGLAAGDTLTVETNHVTAVGGDTISLKHGKPLIWYDGCGWDLADLLTADVTKVFLTTAVLTGSLEIRVLRDAAP